MKKKFKIVAITIIGWFVLFAGTCDGLSSSGGIQINANAGGDVNIDAAAIEAANAAILDNTGAEINSCPADTPVNPDCSVESAAECSCQLP